MGRRKDDTTSEGAVGCAYGFAIGITGLILSPLLFPLGSCLVVMGAFMIIGGIGMLFSGFGSTRDFAAANAEARKKFPPPKSCTKCGEDSWGLLLISPNQKSAHWKCLVCGKKIWCHAVPDPVAPTLWQRPPSGKDMAANVSSFSNLARDICTCRVCFENILRVQVPMTANGQPFDIPQPRWVGPDYWSASPRVLILMTNPGEGRTRQKANAEHLAVLRAFRDGTGTLEDIFAFQLADMPYWGGRRSYIDFYTTSRGLRLYSVALLNIAWCPTQGDYYPKEMLNQCWERNTSRCIRLLAPDVVLLAGSCAGAFRRRVSDTVPDAQLIDILHHANRKSDNDNAKDMETTRRALGGEAAANGSCG